MYPEKKNTKSSVKNTYVYQWSENQFYLHPLPLLFNLWLKNSAANGQRLLEFYQWKFWIPTCINFLSFFRHECSPHIKYGTVPWGCLSNLAIMEQTVWPGKMKNKSDPNAICLGSGNGTVAYTSNTSLTFPTLTVSKIWQLYTLHWKHLFSTVNFSNRNWPVLQFSCTMYHYMRLRFVVIGIYVVAISLIN